MFSLCLFCYFIEQCIKLVHVHRHKNPSTHLLQLLFVYFLLLVSHDCTCLANQIGHLAGTAMNLIWAAHQSSQFILFKFYYYRNGLLVYAACLFIYIILSGSLNGV